MHDSYFGELEERIMEMQEYVDKNYNRLLNDFKVIKDLPLDQEIPNTFYEGEFSDYISERYKMEIRNNYKVEE